MRWGAVGNTKKSFAPGLKYQPLHNVMRVLGACPTETTLLRRMICGRLHRYRQYIIITVFQRKHLQFFLLGLP